MQAYISAVVDEFNFLNNLEDIYNDHSGSESETPGPFTRLYPASDAELDDGYICGHTRNLEHITGGSVSLFIVL